MTKMKTLAINAAIPDELLDSQDPATVLRSEGLLGELKKVLAERMPNAEMAVHLEAEAEQQAGNHSHGRARKRCTAPNGYGFNRAIHQWLSICRKWVCCPTRLLLNKYLSSNAACLQ
jgi:hypothetical protein